MDSGIYGSAGADIGVATVGSSGVLLSGVPTSQWTYGCSATSAGMLFGYYDRTGYDDMYTGSANGGVAPLVDLGASCSLIATKFGFDGRTTAGHVDDYWVSYTTAGPDPWEASGVEHEWGGCVADYLGTNQWKWDFVDGDGVIDFNTDGSTAVFMYNSGARLYDYIPSASAGIVQTAFTHGLRLFAESRGYEVVTNFTQRIDNYTGGFTFLEYVSEIEAGRPVFMQMDGHTMLGVGYDAASELVYVHDTWDNDVHSFTWGGSYAGMAQKAVTVFELAVIPEPAAVIFLLGGSLFGLLRRRRGSGRGV